MQSWRRRMERLAALKSTAHIHITSFHGGRSRSPLGSTILKRRQVPSIVGIELVSVQYIDIIDSHSHNHNRLHLSVKVKAKSHLLYQLYCTYACCSVTTYTWCHSEPTRSDWLRFRSTSTFSFTADSMLLSLSCGISWAKPDQDREAGISSKLFGTDDHVKNK